MRRKVHNLKLTSNSQIIRHIVTLALAKGLYHSDYPALLQTLSLAQLKDELKSLKQMDAA